MRIKGKRGLIHIDRIFLRMCETEGQKKKKSATVVRRGQGVGLEEEGWKKEKNESR